MQLQGRDAVLLVVEPDALEQRVVAGVEPGLERLHRLGAARDVRAALELVERLHLLDRVARHRRAQRLPRDAVEVDEHLAAEEVVDLLLARAVLAREPRERAPLVRRVVVDVEAGEAAAALGQVVDELLERLLLAGAIVRPQALVARRSGLVQLDPAEEVLEPARRLEPRMPFEVEPDVAGRRLGQEGEAALRLLREQLELVPARVPAVQLELGLVAEPREGVRPDLRDARVGRRRAERLHRPDAAGEEPVVLEPRHARDERQVVVVLPLLLAPRQELAEPAVLDGVRIRRRAAVFDDRAEALAHAAVVGGEVLRPEGFALPGAGDDVHLAAARAR